MITRGDLFGTVSEFAASSSIEDLLAAFPPDLQAGLSDWCRSLPEGRENWIVVKGSTRRIGSDEQEASCRLQHREREDRSYQGYCKLHNYFHNSTKT